MPRPKKTATTSKTPADPGKIVQIWESSPIVYGWDSRDRTANPDFHPTIGLTHKGVFVNGGGIPIPLESVPEYVRTAAKTVSLDITPHPAVRQTMSMRDAMLGAGVPNTDPENRAARG